MSPKGEATFYREGRRYPRSYRPSMERRASAVSSVMDDADEAPGTQGHVSLRDHLLCVLRPAVTDDTGKASRQARPCISKTTTSFASLGQRQPESNTLT